jgi:hypothetical protein
MVFVKITQIKSITDPETGEDGKEIQFSEIRKTPGSVLRQSDEAKIVQEMMNQLRMMGLPVITRQDMKLPKLIIFLTEDECEKLQIDLIVNRVYDLKFWMGKIELTEISS